MATTEELATGLMEARRAYDEAQETSRDLMVASVEAYNRLLSRMLSMKLPSVDLPDGGRAILKVAHGISFLEFEDPPESHSGRPEFGGRITAHDHRGN